MALKRRSITKLASLSAAGVGALGFTAHKAQASVVFSGPVNAQVGFDTGFNPTFTSASLGSGSANFNFHTVGSKPNVDTHRRLLFGGNSLQFKAFSTGTIRIYSSNATFSSFSAGAHHAQSGHIATLIGLNLTPFPSLLGFRSFTDQFALFSFTSGVNTLFGWVELTLSDNDRPGPPAYGPDLTIVSYAYSDINGRKLAAGSLSDASPVPEPATFGMTGLAALGLGALGLRRWRAARKA